jgi:rhamnose transport system ATP-binding protein
MLSENRKDEGIFPELSVGKNLILMNLSRLSTAGWLRKERIHRAIQDLIGRLSIATFNSNRQILSQLSGGNQQKVVVGKWLASKPKLLIVDEPTRGVDVGAKAEIHRLMSELAQQGLGILMISSELPEVLGMSDRILVMRQGRLVAEFSRAEADQHNVGSAMMSDQVVLDEPSGPAPAAGAAA